MIVCVYELTHVCVHVCVNVCVHVLLKTLALQDTDWYTKLAGFPMSTTFSMHTEWSARIGWSRLGKGRRRSRSGTFEAEQGKAGEGEWAPLRLSSPTRGGRDWLAVSDGGKSSKSQIAQIISVESLDWLFDSIPAGWPHPSPLALFFQSFSHFFPSSLLTSYLSIAVGLISPSLFPMSLNFPVCVSASVLATE